MITHPVNLGVGIPGGAAIRGIPDITETEGRLLSTATGLPQIERSKSRTFVLELAKNARKFNRRYAWDLVRDERVGGALAYYGNALSTTDKVANVNG